jgi:site-specific DNA-methyltransferase (adenine-specific)
MRALPDRSFDVAILDPPYSERQHAGVRSSGRNRGLADGNGRMSPSTTKRVVDLGFSHFTRSHCLRTCYELARLVRRWSLVFCDDDLLLSWREAASLAGLPLIRTGVWVRIGGAPQFTGDRPAAGVEYVLIFHPKGRKRWNGGGSAAVWQHPIVANRSGHRTDRVHATQKPESLMLDLVRLFSEPSETILDPFAGSGTTGVASIRFGRHFVGCELDVTYAATARDRLQAEQDQISLASARAGQISLFGASHAR